MDCIIDIFCLVSGFTIARVILYVIITKANVKQIIKDAEKEHFTLRNILAMNMISTVFTLSANILFDTIVTDSILGVIVIGICSMLLANVYTDHVYDNKEK